MSDFPFDIIKLLAVELKSACSEHGAAYPKGDWKSANTRIGRARLIADATLEACGLWPVGKRSLGNDDVLVLLDTAVVEQGGSTPTTKGCAE